jgi:hypothetical protein
MFILWIKKRKAVKSNNRVNDDKLLFHSHDEDMKKFRAQHPDNDMESVDDILFTEGNSLAPVHKVKLNENIQN